MSPVSKTLFFTLCARANEKSFDDQIAKTILNNHPEIKKYSPGYFSQKIISQRAKYIDEEVKTIIKYSKQEHFSLINLGGGLCSRFDRLKQFIDESFHLDLPEVIELLNDTFPYCADHLIGIDLTSNHWYENIHLANNTLPIFTMEGVSMYLKQNEFIKVIDDIIKKFPQGHLVADFLHPFFINKSYLIRDVSKVGANFKSGLASPQIITQLFPKLKLIKKSSPIINLNLPNFFPFNAYYFATFSWNS